MGKRNISLMIILAVLVLVTLTTVVVASVYQFDKNIRETRAQIINSAAKLAAEQIDGDKVNK